MASSLGELFIELGVFSNTKELKEFEDKLKRVNKTMEETKAKNDTATKSTRNFLKEIRNIAIAVTGAIYALSRLSNSLIQSNQEFLNLTRNSDIALGTFQKWNNVGRMFGVKNAAQQLFNLNQRLYELKLTGEGADGFILAGINPLGSDAEGVLEQLRKRVANLDDTSATFLLSRMGLDPTMLHLLRMTREEFEAYNQATSKYRLTEEQSRQLQKMNAQLEIASIKIQYLKDRAILAILPYFVKFMNVISDLGDEIKQLMGWLNGNSGWAKFVKFILKAVAGFTHWIITLNTLIKTFSVLAGVITTARMALLALTSHPIIAAITAVLGLVMLIANHYQKLNVSKGLNGLGGIENNQITRALPAMQQMNQSIDNRKYANTRNNNSQITMNNTIHTTETAKAISNELAYYQYAQYGYSY